MAWNYQYVWNATPPGHAWPETDKWLHVHYDDEPVTFSLLAPNQTTVAAPTYEVRDYYGTVVRAGQVTGTTLDLGVMPLGWYKIYFVRATPVDSNWRTSGGEGMFCVVRRNAALPARPALGSPTGADPMGEGVDYPTRGITRMGPWRHTVDVHATNYTAQRDGAVSDASLERNTWGTPDPARPLVQFANMPHAPVIDGVVTNPAVSHPTQVADTAAALAGAGVSVLEGFNEPNNFNFSNRTPAGWAQWTRELRQVVKAAAPDMRIAGPSSISIHGNGLTFIRDCLLAAGDDVDVVSFHAYNAVNGDLAAGRRTYGALKAMLASIGMAHKPLLNSEGGSYFATNYGSFVPRQQTQRAMLEFHILEQMGIPKEQFCYFYDRAHGFWDYPSWWISAEAGRSYPHPLLAVMRVWSEELAGKRMVEALDFGTLDNDHFIGTRCENPTTGESVVILQSGGRVGDVTFTLSGHATGSVPLISTFGAASQVQADARGLVKIKIGMEPVYARLPAGARLAPEKVEGIDVGYGWRSTPSASHAPEADNPVSSIANGVLDNEYNSGTKIYRSVPIETGDAWAQITFPRTARIDRIVIDCPEPWQHGASLLDFDVQALVDGTWTTVDSRTIEERWVEWTSMKQNGDCYSDTYWSREHIFVTALPQIITADAVRVLARKISHGGEVVKGAVTGGSVNLDCGQGISVPKLGIREITACLTSGAGSGLPSGYSGRFLIT